MLSPGLGYSEREIRNLQKGVQERDSCEKDFSHLMIMLSIKLRETKLELIFSLCFRFSR